MSQHRWGGRPGFTRPSRWARDPGTPRSVEQTGPVRANGGSSRGPQHSPAWAPFPLRLQRLTKDRGATVPGRPVYSEGAHALWLTRQTVVLASGLRALRQENRAEAWQGWAPGRRKVGVPPWGAGKSSIFEAHSPESLCPSPGVGQRGSPEKLDGADPAVAFSRPGERQKGQLSATSGFYSLPPPNLALCWSPEDPPVEGCCWGQGENGLQRKVGFIAII